MAERFSLNNLESLNEEAWKDIAPNTLDAILLDGAYLAQRDRAAVLDRLSDALKPGGTFVLTDYRAPARRCSTPPALSPRQRPRAIEPKPKLQPTRYGAALAARLPI